MVLKFTWVTTPPQLFPPCSAGCYHLGSHKIKVSVPNHLRFCKMMVARETDRIGHRGILWCPCECATVPYNVMTHALGTPGLDNILFVST